MQANAALAFTLLKLPIQAVDIRSVVRPHQRWRDLNAVRNNVLSNRCYIDELQNMQNQTSHECRDVPRHSDLLQATDAIMLRCFSPALTSRKVCLAIASNEPNVHVTLKFRSWIVMMRTDGCMLIPRGWMSTPLGEMRIPEGTS